MPTTLQPEDSYRRKVLPSVADVPAIPDLGQSDWKLPLDAFQEVHSDLIDRQDGQLEIGVSGVAAHANPTVAPTLSPSTGGSLGPGEYGVGYTWKNAFGETLISPQTTITFASGTTNRIAVSAITPLPARYHRGQLVHDRPGRHYL
jgi:hypothetical protein